MSERLTSRSKSVSSEPQNNLPERLTYRSKWVLPDPWKILENGYVQMTGGTIEAVGSGTSSDHGPVLDLGQGALIAPLVNTHTHLELSALKGLVPMNMGFRQWVSELLRVRATLTPKELISGATDSVNELDRSGCRLVGEISTLGITQRLLMDSSLSGIFFHEHLGSVIPNDLKTGTSSSLQISLAVHAPHTSSPALIRSLKAATLSRKLPMSIHLAESEDETVFITTGRGNWADFLKERNIEFSGWPLPANSPVHYLYALGVLDANTIAVHLINCSDEDMNLLRSSNTTVCFCPRSNRLLHQKLPDIPRFLATGFKPCLGTDSLASSPSLSVLDEMAFIFEQYPGVSPADILAMGTVYGAVALGLQKRYGRLAPGFGGSPVYVPVKAEKSTEVLPAIMSAGSAGIE